MQLLLTFLDCEKRNVFNYLAVECTPFLGSYPNRHTQLTAFL